MKGSEKPGLVRDEYTATLPNADWIDKLAKRLGLTVEFVPAEEVNNGDSNAMIVGNNVKIARSGTDRGLRFLTGHEFTHHMQDVSPKAYKSFKKAVKKAMGNRYYEAVANTEANYRRHGIVIPLSQAEDEVVADYAGSLVQDVAEVERFINGMTPNRSLIEKIIDALKHLRDFFTDRDIYNLENAIKKFENMLSDSEAQVTRLDPELQNVEMKADKSLADNNRRTGEDGEQGNAGKPESPEQTESREGPSDNRGNSGSVQKTEEVKPSSEKRTKDFSIQTEELSNGTEAKKLATEAVMTALDKAGIPVKMVPAEIAESVAEKHGAEPEEFSKKDSEQRKEKKETERVIDQAVSFVTGKDLKTVREERKQRNAEHKELAKKSLWHCIVK